MPWKRPFATMLALALISFALQPGGVLAQAAGGAEAPNYLTDAEREAGWELMFNGQNLDGWRISNENPDSVTVEDNNIVTHGPRAHLFYGSEGDEPRFQDFEFQCDVYCDGPSNAGIFFHTHWQAGGWPRNGFEAQVCNGFGDPRKTGSIYAISDIRDNSPAEDDAWFHYRIRVEGNNVKIWIDGEEVMDWTQPDDWDNERQSLDGGTFALQAHDPNSRVLFRNLKVRELE